MLYDLFEIIQIILLIIIDVLITDLILNYLIELIHRLENYILATGVLIILIHFVIGQVLNRVYFNDYLSWLNYWGWG